MPLMWCQSAFQWEETRQCSRWNPPSSAGCWQTCLCGGHGERQHGLTATFTFIATTNKQSTQNETKLYLTNPFSLLISRRHINLWVHFVKHKWLYCQVLKHMINWMLINKTKGFYVSFKSSYSNPFYWWEKPNVIDKYAHKIRICSLQDMVFKWLLHCANDS